MNKVVFKGIIRSIQPRIRLTRSFDESLHTYLGYAIVLSGWVDNGVEFAPSDHDHTKPADFEQVFSIGIGKATQEKNKFNIGDVISGDCVSVADGQLEVVDHYKVAKLKKISECPGAIQTSPPWRTIPPDLEMYRERGPRRLAARTYETKCSTCIWGCRMPVEIIIDNWDPGKRKYRTETFCYGPLSCKFYKAGPNRKVEGRNGMVYVEEDWVDEEMTSHRSWDE